MAGAPHHLLMTAFGAAGSQDGVDPSLPAMQARPFDAEATAFRDDASRFREKADRMQIHGCGPDAGWSVAITALPPQGVPGRAIVVAIEVRIKTAGEIQGEGLPPGTGRIRRRDQELPPRLARSA